MHKSHTVSLFSLLSFRGGLVWRSIPVYYLCKLSTTPIAPTAAVCWHGLSTTLCTTVVTCGPPELLPQLLYVATDCLGGTHRSIAVCRSSDSPFSPCSGLRFLVQGRNVACPTSLVLRCCTQDRSFHLVLELMVRGWEGILHCSIPIEILWSRLCRAVLPFNHCDSMLAAESKRS